jgi:predicted O-methyltransferase YrrM
MISSFQIKSFLNYWLDAVDGHSLHSPFYFDLYEKVIKGRDNEDYSLIEKLRAKLLQNPTPLIYADPGSGAKQPNERTIKEIANTSLSPARFSTLYARLAKYQFSRNIIELGASLGINTLYLATDKKCRVTTFEGVPAIAAVAQSTFEFAAASNITLIEGNIDSTLPRWLDEHEKVDLAFIDANHRYAPTMNYFHLVQRKVHFKSVIIMDDIHYTADMEKAWNEIKNDPLVYGSIDLYRSGILFFDPSLNKQHVVLQY